jgi:septum site-determining protein MinC
LNRNLKEGVCVVNWQQGGQTTELLLDLSQAANSARACQLLDEFLRTLVGVPAGLPLDINAGDLLLTRGVLMKMRQQILRQGAVPGIMYATLPQTQQAALDEGLFVKEKPGSGPDVPMPIRQGLPGNRGPEREAKGGFASRPAQPALSGHASRSGAASVDLPVFGLESRISQGESEPPASEVALPGSVTQGPSGQERLDQGRSVQGQALREQAFGDAIIEEFAVHELITESLETSGDKAVGRSAAPVDRPESERQELLYPPTAPETLYWRQTLRSGQILRFQGNIVIIGDVHAGSEIIAGGDIVVWGELRGLAHAGTQGSYKAEIRAMRIEALQLRIADYIARRPDRIYYHKEEMDGVFSPEVARVADGEIKIFKSRMARL